MGFFNSIVKVTSVSKRRGANIDKQGVFESASDAHTPQNPSDWRVFRFGQETRAPRTFSEQEAMRLEKQVEITKQRADSSKRAYAAKKQIKSAETVINKAHYDYESHCIKENAEVIGAKASHANNAIEAGIAFEGMQIALNSQERKANEEIRLLESEFHSVW